MTSIADAPALAVPPVIRLVGEARASDDRARATTRSPSLVPVARRRLVGALLVAYQCLIWGGALCVASALPLAASHPLSRLAALIVAPALFLLCLVVIAGALSRLTRRAMVPGRFPRDLAHAVYGARRLHAICWTSIYYVPPIYHAILAIPALKRLTFRLFGYAGDLDFTVYPDTWVRDLPLLSIGQNAYIANRATLGTNICLASGDIVVGPITVGAGAVVGHMAVLGLGDVIGESAEIGVTTTLGIHVVVGARTVVGARCGLDHGARVGQDCVIESTCVIGKKAVIGDGITLRFGSVVPARAVIRTQAEANRYAPSALDSPRVREGDHPAAAPTAAVRSPSASHEDMRSPLPTETTTARPAVCTFE